VILEYQLIEKGENVAKRNFFGFECFRSGLKPTYSTPFVKNREAQVEKLIQI